MEAKLVRLICEREKDPHLAGRRKRRQSANGRNNNTDGIDFALEGFALRARLSM